MATLSILKTLRSGATALLAGLALASAAPVRAGCPQLTPSQARAEMRIERGGVTDAEIASMAFPTNPQVDVSAWKSFCADKPAAVACAGGRGHLLKLREVKRIDMALRLSFEYRSDAMQYGREDVWNDATTCGDCEDYALTLASRLHQAGERGGAMRLMAWLPVPWAAHATLVVQTADAGEVEVGVGRHETPHPYDLTKGVRVGYLVMDGHRTWRTLAGSLVI